MVFYWAVTVWGNAVQSEKATKSMVNTKNDFLAGFPLNVRMVSTFIKLLSTLSTGYKPLVSILF